MLNLLLELVIAFSGWVAAGICLQAAYTKTKTNEEGTATFNKNKDIVPSYWIMQENEHRLYRSFTKQ